MELTAMAAAAAAASKPPKSAKRRRLRLFDVYMNHLFPLLDTETLLHLGAASTKLWAARKFFLEQQLPLCVCRSIHNCPTMCKDFLTERTPRHNPDCASKGVKVCPSFAHQCMKDVWDVHTKCPCPKKYGRLDSFTTFECLANHKCHKKRNICPQGKCQCTACASGRLSHKKWLVSWKGRCAQREHEERLRQEKERRRRDAREERERKQQLAAHNAMIAEERQRLIDEEHHTAKELDQNRCRFGLCGDGQPCLTCVKFFCAWRLYYEDRICIECEKKEFREHGRTEPIYRP